MSIGEGCGFVSTGLFWFIDAIICDKNRNMSLQEEMEGVHGALMQLFEQYDAVPSHEDRVQMVQDVRDLLSVAMQTAEQDAEGNAEDDLLNRIRELDDALEQAMNAPDNEIIGLLESASDMSQDLVVRAEYMGGNRRPMRTRRMRKKRTLRKRTHRGKTHRGKTHRGKTHRRK